MALLSFRFMKPCDMFELIVFIHECTMCCSFMNCLYDCIDCVIDGKHYILSLTHPVYQLQKHTAKGLLDEMRVPHLGNIV